MPNPTFTQIAAEPEKWDLCLRVYENGRWCAYLAPLYAREARRWLERFPDRAVFARPRGSRKPFRKVEE